MKEQWRQAQSEMQGEIERLRAAKDQSDGRCNEMKHELDLLQDKHSEESHKARPRAAHSPSLPPPYCTHLAHTRRVRAVS